MLPSLYWCFIFPETLKDDVLFKVAKVVCDIVEQIGPGLLGLQFQEVVVPLYDKQHSGNYNRLLQKWRNRPTCSASNSAPALLNILQEAAQKDGLATGEAVRYLQQKMQAEVCIGWRKILCYTKTWQTGRRLT